MKNKTYVGHCQFCNFTLEVTCPAHEVAQRFSDEADTHLMQCDRYQLFLAVERRRAMAWLN